MSEKSNRSFFCICVILILVLVPILQTLPSNLMQPQTASATGTIVLNGTKTTSGTASLPSFQITISNFNVGTDNNRALVVGVEASSKAVNSITFNGTSLTKAVNSFNSNDAELWYMKNPNGTGNIVVTMNGPASVVVGAYSFFGVDQTNPISNTTKNHDNCSPCSNSPTISITTVNSNSWVIDSPSIFGGVTLSSPTCTSQWNLNVNNPPIQSITGASSSQTTTSPGSVTCSWTASSFDHWDDVAIELKAASPSVPAAPTNPTSTAISTTQIQLKWTAPSNGGSPITGYQIQRASTSWVNVINNTGNTTTNYNVTALAANSVYKYHIAAWNSVGLGAYSSNVTGYTLSNSPTGLSANTISSHQINLSWTAPSGGNGTITGYKIERSTDSGTTWNTIVSNTGSTSTTYSNTGLVASTPYTYRASAINSVGTSQPSNTASATTTAGLASTGILAPIYTIPYNGNIFNWQSVNDTKNSHPQVPLFVIINPNNGLPATTNCSSTLPPNIPAFNKGTANLTKSGVVVLGYVFTLNGLRDQVSVENEITKYQTCLPSVKGILFDQMSTVDNSILTSYYQTLTNFAKSKGFVYTVGNPGTDTVSSYIGKVDTLNIFENSVWPKTSDLQGSSFWRASYDKHNFSFQSYNQSSLASSAVIGNASNYVGFMYVTDNTGCGGSPTSSCTSTNLNPWNTTSTYINTLATYLNKSSAIINISSIDSTGHTITGDFVKVMQNGTQIPSGQTPLAYNATTGVTYHFIPNSLSGCTFDHWLDTSSTTADRTIHVNSTSANFTAVFSGSGCP